MILFFGIASILVVVVHSKCAVKQCPDAPRLFNELGCVPDNSGISCPIRYICPDFTSFNKSQCHVKGINYNNGDYLRSTDAPLCRGGCKCVVNKINSHFQCAIMDCAVPRQPGPNCVVQQNLNQCCPSSYFICGDEAKKLPTCTLLGKTYRQGDIMYPSNVCYKCLCNKGFDNSTAYHLNTNCIALTCGIQFNNNINSIEAGCAPIFDGEAGCCPIGYRCPANDDYVVRTPHRGTRLNVECQFGNLTLFYQDKLNQSNKCVSCDCNHPPMVQCVQKSGCIPGLMN